MTTITLPSPDLSSVPSTKIDPFPTIVSNINTGLTPASLEALTEVGIDPIDVIIDTSGDIYYLPSPDYDSIPSEDIPILNPNDPGYDENELIVLGIDPTDVLIEHGSYSLPLPKYDWAYNDLSSSSSQTIEIDVPNLQEQISEFPTREDIMLSVNYELLKSLGFGVALGLGLGNKSIYAESVVSSGNLPSFLQSGSAKPDPDIEELKNTPGSGTAAKTSSTDPEPPSLLSLIGKPIDTNTKINVIPTNGTSTEISFSIINQPVVKKRASSMRDAINKLRINEDAALELFKLVNIPITTQITLSELLLLAAGFDRAFPLDFITINIVAMNLPNNIKLNTGHLALVFGHIEPEGSSVVLIS